MATEVAQVLQDVQVDLNVILGRAAALLERPLSPTFLEKESQQASAGGDGLEGPPAEKPADTVTPVSARAAPKGKAARPGKASSPGAKPKSAPKRAPRPESSAAASDEAQGAQSKKLPGADGGGKTHAKAAGKKSRPLKITVPEADGGPDEEKEDSPLADRIAGALSAVTQMADQMKEKLKSPPRERPWRNHSAKPQHVMTDDERAAAEEKIRALEQTLEKVKHEGSPRRPKVNVEESPSHKHGSDDDGNQDGGSQCGKSPSDTEALAKRAAQRVRERAAAAAAEEEAEKLRRQLEASEREAENARRVEKLQQVTKQRVVQRKKQQHLEEEARIAENRAVEEHKKKSEEVAAAAREEAERRIQEQQRMRRELIKHDQALLEQMQREAAAQSQAEGNALQQLAIERVRARQAALRKRLQEEEMATRRREELKHIHEPEIHSELEEARRLAEQRARDARVKKAAEEEKKRRQIEALEQAELEARRAKYRGAGGDSNHTVKEQMRDHAHKLESKRLVLEEKRRQLAGQRRQHHGDDVLASQETMGRAGPASPSRGAMRTVSRQDSQSVDATARVGPSERAPKCSQRISSLPPRTKKPGKAGQKAGQPKNTLPTTTTDDLKITVELYDPFGGLCDGAESEEEVVPVRSPGEEMARMVSGSYADQHRRGAGRPPSGQIKSRPSSRRQPHPAPGRPGSRPSPPRTPQSPSRPPVRIVRGPPSCRSSRSSLPRDFDSPPRTPVAAFEDMGIDLEECRRGPAPPPPPQLLRGGSAGVRGPAPAPPGPGSAPASPEGAPKAKAKVWRQQQIAMPAADDLLAKVRGSRGKAIASDTRARASEVDKQQRQERERTLGKIGGPRMTKL